MTYESQIASGSQAKEVGQEITLDACDTSKVGITREADRERVDARRQVIAFAAVKTCALVLQVSHDALKL